MLFILAAVEVKSREGWLQSFLRARIQARWQLVSLWLLKQDRTFTCHGGRGSSEVSHDTLALAIVAPFVS